MLVQIVQNALELFFLVIAVNSNHIPPAKRITSVPHPNKKRVKYSNICLVVLIPTRHELKKAGLDLWYQHTELLGQDYED